MQYWHGSKVWQSLQFRFMQLGYFFHIAFTLGRQVYFDLPQIDGAAFALNQSQGLAARHQCHHAMVLCLQPFSQLGQRRPLPTRVPLGLQEQLVLQRGDALGLACVLAKPQKEPQLIAKLGQRLIV